jgi:hypothetical protein
MLEHEDSKDEDLEVGSHFTLEAKECKYFRACSYAPGPIKRRRFLRLASAL